MNVKSKRFGEKTQKPIDLQKWVSSMEEYVTDSSDRRADLYLLNREKIDTLRKNIDDHRVIMYSWLVIVTVIALVK